MMHAMNRNIILILCARWTSVFGDALHQLALPLIVYHATGSASVLALCFLAETLPWLLVAPMLSTRLKNTNQKLLLVLLDAIRAGLCFLLVAINPPLWAWLAVMFGFGACTSLFNAYRSELLCLCAEGLAINRILGMQCTMTRIITILAPPLGATLLSLGMSARGLFAIDGASYILSGLLYILVGKTAQRISIGGPLPDTALSWRRRLTDLISEIRIKNTLIAEFSRSLSEGIYQPLLIVLIVNILRFPDAVYGWSFTARALAEVAAALLFTAIFKPAWGKFFLIASTLGLGLSLMIMPGIVTAPALLGIVALMGFTMGWRQLLAESTVVEATRGRHQASQIAIYNAVISGAYIIGYAMSAVLTAVLPVTVIYPLCGVTIMAGLIKGFRISAGTRRDVKHAISHAA